MYIWSIPEYHHAVHDVSKCWVGPLVPSICFPLICTSLGVMVLAQGKVTYPIYDHSPPSLLLQDESGPAAPPLLLLPLPLPCLWLIMCVGKHAAAVAVAVAGEVMIFFSPFTSSLAKLQISSRGMRTWHYPRRVESYPVSARLRSPAQLLTNTWWNIDCNVLPCNLLQRLQSGGTMSWGYVCWAWFSSDCIYLLHLQVMRFHRNRCIYSWPELC